MLMSTIKHIKLPLDEDPKIGWKPYPLFSGATRCMDSFSSHVSVLSPGVMPHLPHKHMEEELLILLSGEVDLVVPDGLSSKNDTRMRIRLGSFVYYPAFRAHTIHNAGTKPATYLMFKWHKESASEKETSLDSTLIHYSDYIKNIDVGHQNGIIQRGVLDGQTEYLLKLHCHVTALQPGAGYRPHSDSYDVAIVLLSGMVETLGRKVEPHGVIFYAAGEPHGMTNVGEATASYLVFEFHGNKLEKSKSDSQTAIRKTKTLTMEDMERELSGLYEQNAMLRAQIQNMQMSILWRMTMKYHNCVVERMLPQGSKRRGVYDLAIEGGRVLINEGKGAFLCKFRQHFKI